MDRLDALTLFARIVETRSFTRAANGLNIPRATATHAIQQLETRLGIRLLERTTRQVRPTLDGQAFYERCVHVLSDLEAAEASLRPAAASPRGLLRVDMPSVHASHIVLPRIDDFRRRYPGIELALGSGERLVDLVSEGVDCVIRTGSPGDSSLIARWLAAIPQVICASPDYLAHAGLPQQPDDLVNHHAVKFFSAGKAIDDTFSFVIDGKVQEFPVGGWMSVNDAGNYAVSALRGCGLIQVPHYHVEVDLREGRLIEVLSEWPSPDMTVSALYPHRRHLSPRVRVFVDWVSEIYAEKFGMRER
ncbi:hypothetical protein L861_23080 [Litchfieldella anticariensis FP35 = DSM 16096]|uniref:HTH lysR-type domain-containing protein n=1 Tax=Litchfieldella anticariensis (strain DSM 16096 / CECT 5854 / CIP 108499 / LMG 22089 / FP35) TaxID=1121939 RepID=S2KMP9_LITA3|nr:LysR family transcriptional regulator [Halomonas anticariensis]EPC03195.1 hypothetical protein L861_23080 [Halomonas anticariensis FP35 = DSM 16096]